MTKPNIVESKIVEAGGTKTIVEASTTKTANTAARDGHVTNTAAMHSSDQLDRNSTLGSDYLVHSGNGTAHSRSCLCRIRRADLHHCNR